MRKTQTLIQQLGLKPHPEGGWYRELHRSPDQVQRQDGAERSALTAILFLLPAGAVSCWHRVIGGDEVWTHIDGATLELFQCQGDSQIKCVGLNPGDDLFWQGLDHKQALTACD